MYRWRTGTAGMAPEDRRAMCGDTGVPRWYVKIELDPDPGTDNMAGRPQPMRNTRASTRVDPNDPGTWGKVSRNAGCPCGSGKKYKHCHGRFS